MNKPIPPELISEIESLDDQNIARVLAYTKSLRSNYVLSVRNEKLRRLVGAIAKEDLEEMRVAIHEGCEQIEQTAYSGLTD